MRLQTPEIAWHETLPIYSCDLQPYQCTSIHATGRSPLIDLPTSDAAEESPTEMNDQTWTRLATAGGDNVVRLWLVNLDWISDGCAAKGHPVVQSSSLQKAVNRNPQVTQVTYLASLKRHEKPVNVVRWSPTGEYLASAGDDLFIVIWCNQGSTTAGSSISERREEDDEEDGTAASEHWVPCRSLRRHLEDIYDVCWAPDSQALISGSVDHSVIVWQLDLVLASKSALDVASANHSKSGNCSNGAVNQYPSTTSGASGHTKCLILRDHKHYVQGVTWDPLGFYIASLSSDRACRLYRAGTKTCVAHVAKTGKQRLFQDDSWKSFFRRLTFSPDGLLLACPSGNLEGVVFAGSVAATASLAATGPITSEASTSVALPAAAPQHAAHIFLRSNFTKPIVSLPTGPRPVVCVRFCPQPFLLRTMTNIGPDTDDKMRLSRCLFDLPYRWLFCLVLEDGVLFYDTQQTIPFAQVSQCHYQALNDAAWSADGHLVVVCSTDGYCSLIHFARGELGNAYRGPIGTQVLNRVPGITPLIPDSDMAATDKGKTEPEGLTKNGDSCPTETEITVDSPSKYLASKECGSPSKISPAAARSSASEFTPSRKRRVQLTTLSEELSEPSVEPICTPSVQVDDSLQTSAEKPAREHSEEHTKTKQIAEAIKSTNSQKRRVSFVTIDVAPSNVTTPVRSVVEDVTGVKMDCSSTMDGNNTS